MPPPKFPYTTVDSVERWFNFHHTIRDRAVPMYLTPDAHLTASDLGKPSMLRQAEALNAILEHCFNAKKPERLCILGSKWSLSNVLDPGRVILDPGAFNKLARVDEEWITPAYAADAKKRGGVPVIAQGGIEMGVLNHQLGKMGLALQTSGAADGHRLAGCIATGTHGAAFTVGAVHDTVVAMYLVTGPNCGVLLQPKARRFTKALAEWFEEKTSISTRDVADDTLFHAAQVAIGSLGFVHSVIVEAVPLYQLEGTLIARPIGDKDLWHAMETLDTTVLDPRKNPYNFSVMISPYAGPKQASAFASLVWKKKATGVPYAAPSPATAMMASDTTRFLSTLIGRFDDEITAPEIERLLVKITTAQYTPGPQKPLFPGQMFGPTTLPPGNGRSTEMVVDMVDAGAAVRTVLATLREQAKRGRHLLGIVGVRYVCGSPAHLAMNANELNTYIELPSLGGDVGAIHRACWDALTRAGIPFTCHWGQEHAMTPASLVKYFGEGRIARWKQARNELLPTSAAKAVFRTPILGDVGLG